MGDSVDAVVEPDEIHAAADVGDPADVMALEDALVQIRPILSRHAANVGGDLDILQIGLLDGQNTDQDQIAHSKALVGIAIPRPGDPAAADRALHTEDLHANNLFGYGHDAGLDDTALIDHGTPVSVRIHIEGLALSVHGVHPAGDDAPGAVFNALHNKIDLAPEPGIEPPRHQRHLLCVFRAVRASVLTR